MTGATAKTVEAPEIPARWGEMIEAEPRLAFLEDSVRAVFDDGDPEGGFCANETWLDFKRELSHLAGWFAAHPGLRTSQYWDVAFRRLYHLLPDCRNCICL